MPRDYNGNQYKATVPHTSVSSEWRLDKKHVFILTPLRRLCGSGSGGKPR
jgi:hypothetical protein